jgi:hypothetical protein
MTKWVLLTVSVSLLMFRPTVTLGREGKPASQECATQPSSAAMWADPSDIERRDLFYGPGGSAHVPHGSVTFLKEDLDGTNPKFTVRDSDGVKWKVKLGIEARPETTASRIVWAVGYHANEDYFVSELRVVGMPARLHRGQKLVEPDGTVRNVRLKRESKDEKKVGNWEWRDNVFSDTRALNGLRTLMAVLNNWDLKDENNAIYDADGQCLYTVSDLGASFACAGRCWPPGRSKGDLEKYGTSALIRRLTPETVSFQTPARPRYVYLVNPKEYFSRVKLEWIGKDIPRADARWMGKLLARLTSRQLQAAFLSAGYSSQEADGFAEVIARRIDALTDL